MMRRTKFHTHTEEQSYNVYSNPYVFRRQTKTTPAKANNKYSEKITTNYVTQKSDSDQLSYGTHFCGL